MSAIAHPPAKTPDSTTRKTQPAAGHASRRHSPELILVVDDEKNVRESLGEVLETEHYAVRLARDGRDAVRQFLQGPPDLILLDIHMPDINGWQVLEILAELYPFVPVILITARGGQLPRAAAMGADTLLEKPLDIPALLRSIRELLARPQTAHFANLLRVWRREG